MLRQNTQEQKTGIMTVKRMTNQKKQRNVARKEQKAPSRNLVLIMTIIVRVVQIQKRNVVAKDQDAPKEQM